MKVLLIIEQCNPAWASVPLVGYNLFNGISELADVTLVTHERNKKALEKVRNARRIEYIMESPWISKYFRMSHKLLAKGSINWPLRHALAYPVYAEFNHKVYLSFRDKVSCGHYDLVHAITPMIPRYPVKIVRACKKTPFILGPVNGGIPFPEGVKDVARKEFAHLNFLRTFSKLIPGYSNTYRNSDKVLAGSTYTLNMLKNMFSMGPERIRLFFENGITKEFFLPAEKTRKAKSSLRLLFVGRLVPYKGADMLIKAISLFDDNIREKVSLSIVGDGPERENLERQAESLGICRNVNFAGWVDQHKTIEYYRNSDIFCFPSVREFGGAVVLEAMASGLPCIVVNHGGIGEYLTDGAGFKIEPVSRDRIVSELAKKIALFSHDQGLIRTMSLNAVERAKDFQWEIKSQKIIDIYEEVINKRNV